MKLVMPGLVPGIDVVQQETWMAGTGTEARLDDARPADDCPHRGRVKNRLNTLFIRHLCVRRGIRINHRLTRALNPAR